MRRIIPAELQVEKVVDLGDGRTRITLMDRGDVLYVESNGSVTQKYWTGGASKLKHHNAGTGLALACVLLAESM